MKVVVAPLALAELQDAGAFYTLKSGMPLSRRPVTPHPAVDPVRFALWTLRHETAQRQSS